ncbi:DUF222 domain-containing protein [Microbacterium koreense]|uniref:DUF222 domain-containing protein n=1 Tax=Microbacterium koreense TaxID=323761 RepID=A0ABW2ZQ36_9MICO
MSFEPNRADAASSVGEPEPVEPEPVEPEPVESPEPFESEPLEPLDLVVESAAMVAIFAAERLMRIARMHADAIASVRYGVSVEIVERSLRLELASALRITEYAAGELLALAEGAVMRYPSIATSLHRADMTEQHADILVKAVDAVEPAHRERVLARGIELAEVESVGPFRRAMKKLVESLRVETLPERHERALTERRVAVETVDDGMAWIHVFAPAVEAHAIYGRATAMAKVLRAVEGETRTLDQLRADIVADLLIDGSCSAHPSEARGIRATVAVTVPALSLLDADIASSGGEPASVEGIGPIPIDMARTLCGGADGWMRILTHPETGMVLSVGRRRYQPPPALRKLVAWRAERCMAPGCGMPAARCQIDHNVAWEHGGSTALDNLAPLCQGHHTVKHHGGWAVRQIAGSGGAIEWISPVGRRYIVRPVRAVPIFRPSGGRHPDGEVGGGDDSRGNAPTGHLAAPF